MRTVSAHLGAEVDLAVSVRDALGTNTTFERLGLSLSIPCRLRRLNLTLFHSHDHSPKTEVTLQTGC
jgi:hypothetical protein